MCNYIPGVPGVPGIPGIPGIPPRADTRGRYPEAPRIPGVPGVPGRTGYTRGAPIYPGTQGDTRPACCSLLALLARANVFAPLRKSGVPLSKSPPPPARRAASFCSLYRPVVGRSGWPTAAMTRRGLVSFTQPSEAAEIPFTQPTEQKCEVPSVLVDLSSDLEFCLPAAGSKATGCSLVEGLEQEKIFTYFPLCSKQSREPRPNDFQCNALFA